MKNILFVLTILLVACGKKSIQSHQANIEPKAKKYVDNQLTAKGDINAIKSELVNHDIQLNSVENLADDIYLLKIKKDAKTNLEQISKKISESSAIDFIEPNYILSVEKNKTPKDPLWLSQWALKNYGQDSPNGIQGKAGADIQALKAWELSKGSKEIIVGVVDTGIDYNHPDLKANMWVNEKELNGIAGQDDDGNGYADDVYGWNAIAFGHDKPYYGQIGSPDPMDDNSHGTHCAGIIGASGNNFKGVVGANWKVSLMALKFLNKDGSGTTVDAYRAINYGIINKAHILSNSWGGGSKSELLKFVIKKAEKEGILFVAAAGNDGTNNDEAPHYPSNYEVENVLSVAASDNRDHLASFSCYGKNTVHIAAPGVDIMSTIPLSKAGNNGAYASFSGTSMATPYVSGAAALMMAHDPSLRYQALKVKNILMNTVDVKSQLTGKVASRGRLNLLKALNKEFNPTAGNNFYNTEKLSITSPRYNQEVFDKTWTIEKENAERLRVNFDFVMFDLGFDLIAIYDQNYNLIHQFERNHMGGFKTPWIEGSKIHVRMANALVFNRIATPKPFKTPDDGFKAGANLCETKTNPDGTETFMCYIDEDSKPFANYESDGFSISSVDYQNAKKEVK